MNKPLLLAQCDRAPYASFALAQRNIALVLLAWARVAALLATGPALASGVGAVGLGCSGGASSPVPPTGCAALSSCCMMSKVPPAAASGCSGVLGIGDDTTCDELLTEYEIDGYCGSDIHVVDGGSSATLGADCAALLACCSQATFSGSASDCDDAVYGGSQKACDALLTSYAGGGKCGDMFDAGAPPEP
jgi:hypothetical protein